MSIELAPKVREAHAVYLLVFLLVLHLTLLSLQVEDPGGMTVLRKWMLAASAPVINLSAAASRSASDVWLNYVWLRGAREENMRLRQSVQELSLQTSSLEQLRLENLRLRRLLHFSEPTPLRSIGARVVGRVPDYLSKTMYLNRGSADGIHVDSAVVNADGVVGRVALVTAQSCQVQLITNADASVGVFVERTGFPGVLKGQGSPHLVLDYISGTEDVAVGDMVLTSGLDRIYPRGLPVGRVTESAKGHTVFRDISVEPAADLLQISEVLILLGRQATADPGPPMSPDERSLRD